MHNIEYMTFSADTPKQEIEKTIFKRIRHSGDGYGTDKIMFSSAEPQPNERLAEEYIQNNDSGWYGGLAVRFVDTSETPDSPQIKKMLDKRRDALDRWREYNSETFVGKRKSAFIGCSSCKSSLNREKLRTNKCPLCGTDLRSNTVQERLARLNTRVDLLDAEIEQARIHNANKDNIKWLVKFEWHS